MIQPQAGKPVRIGVVGPCTAGKSTLIRRLAQEGIVARHIAQEHSYVPDMWQRITNPELLVFLDVSYPFSLQRRKLNWTEADLAEQQHRLRHARAHADFYLQTDQLDPEQVYQAVMAFLKQVS